jgi:hypothetical protein
MRTSRPLFLLTLALASGIPAAAQGQPRPDAPAATSAAATERARKLYDEAARLYDEGRYAQAYVAFAAAWAIKKQPGMAGNLADCAVKLGKHRDAAEHLRDIVKDTSGEVKEDDKGRARQRLSWVLKQVGVVTIMAGPGAVEIALDGAPLGKSPLADSVFVDPGRHTLDGRREGYAPARVTFDAAAGSTQEVQISLKPKGTDQPPARPPIPERRSVVPGAVLGGVAGAAVVTGAVLLGVGASKRSSVQSTSGSILSEHHTCVVGALNYDPRCAQAIAEAHTTATLHDAGVGVLVGGIALTAATVGYFLWPAPARSGTRGVRAMPLVSTTSAGMAVSGAF